MEQIAILASYDIQKAKNIAKRLAGIRIDRSYTFDRLGKIPELNGDQNGGRP
jgi:hypothetical protein